MVGFKAMLARMGAFEWVLVAFLVMFVVLAVVYVVKVQA
jgi:hypothetical protein